MHIFVTGGTGHAGPYIISELIADLDNGHYFEAIEHEIKQRSA